MDNKEILKVVSMDYLGHIRSFIISKLVTLLQPKDLK